VFILDFNYTASTRLILKQCGLSDEDIDCILICVMFPLLQCLLKWSYLKGSGTLLRIAEGIKKHTLEGWVGLPIAKLLERNKVKRLSLFGSFLAFEKRTPPQ